MFLSSATRILREHPVQSLPRVSKGSPIVHRVRVFIVTFDVLYRPIPVISVLFPSGDDRAVATNLLRRSMKRSTLSIAPFTRISRRVVRFIPIREIFFYRRSRSAGSEALLVYRFDSSAMFEFRSKRFPSPTVDAISPWFARD